MVVEPSRYCASHYHRPPFPVGSVFFPAINTPIFFVLRPAAEYPSCHQWAGEFISHPKLPPRHSRYAIYNERALIDMLFIQRGMFNL